MSVVAVYLDRHLLAELLPSGAAMVALGAALIMVHHHALADPRLLGIDRGADRDHDAAGFVPSDDGTVPHRNAGRLGLALRAAVLMQVAAAHAGRLHLDNHVMGFRSGIGERHQFQSAFSREYNAAHGFLRLLLFVARSWTEKSDRQRANRRRSGATNDGGFRQRLCPRGNRCISPNLRSMRDPAHMVRRRVLVVKAAVL